MSTKTNGKDGQHNRYTFYPGGKHEHEWYDSKSGKSGYHGENASDEDKKWIGELSKKM